MKILSKVAPFKYEVDPPKHHPEFEGVVVTATPKAGVCMVTAAGRNHPNDAYGVEVRSEFSEIAGEISAVYGTSRLNDFLLPGALFKGASEWTFSITKNERSYQGVWKAKHGGTLENNVVEILLTARGIGLDTSYLHLQFEFKNFPSCEEEIRNSAQKAF